MHDLEQLFDRFERVKPSELSRAEAERLAQLIQSDSRCCAALPRTFAGCLALFPVAQRPPDGR